LIAQKPGKAQGEKEEEEVDVEGSPLSHLYTENFFDDF
jgi:hypothetical protein